MRKYHPTLLLYLCGFLFWTFDLPMMLPGQSSEDYQVKKFIELGWDIPNTAYLKANHEEMQKTTPFDGVLLSLETVDSEGKHVSTQRMMNARPWDPAWFETVVADLESCRWTTYTDNFIRVNFTPGEVPWEDDHAWKTFSDKTALCAKIAKQTDLKGLAIDFEPYGKPIFKYDPLSGRTFQQAKHLARQRGSQWMKAIAAEYPDMVFFTLFILDFVPKVNERDDIDSLLETAGYGLLPAFFNGMLDVVPPEMKIVDGCESGYYQNGLDEFIRRAFSIQSIGGPAIRAIALENRQKYISQVQVGFGFYLDMYTNPEGSKYYRGPKEGGTRLDRLVENLVAAREATDEYVWIYGEKRRWWKPADPETKWESWEEAMPGMTDAIRLVKNPTAILKQKLDELRRSGTMKNIAQNADFSTPRPGRGIVNGKSVELQAPEHWTSWQDKPIGTFSWDGEVGGGSAKASNVKWGCFLQGHPAKTGDCFLVSLDARRQGNGTLSLTVRWQDADGKWTQESQDRSFRFRPDPIYHDSGPLADGWLRAAGVVTVPPGAAKILLLPGVKSQESTQDIIWFDNAFLVKIE